jgi:sulfur carrier protein
VITVNGEAIDSEGVSIESLLLKMRVEARGVAVALNGEIVRRSDWPLVSVSSGDRVEIVTAAAGGF